MRIISKFHDYYDTVQKLGYDKTLVYNRQLVEEKEDKLLIEKYKTAFVDIPIFGYAQRSMKGNYDIEFTTLLVGFCGKVYPVIKVHLYNYGTPATTKDFYVYNTGEIISMLSINLLKKELKNFLEPDKRKRGEWGSNFKKYYVDKLFSFTGKKIDIDLFRNINAPVFLLEHKAKFYGAKIIINPSLKDICFFKRMDAYTTYQEISMFLGGVLGVGNPPITKIDDKSMMYEKGFDDMSFKTISPGKKTRRRSK